MGDHLEYLKGAVRDLLSNPDSDCEDIVFGENIKKGVAEIERLRTALRAARKVFKSIGYDDDSIAIESIDKALTQKEAGNG